MKPERFALLKEILLAVADLPESERKSYLDAACAGDPELRRKAESMLARAEDPSPIMRTGGGFAPAARTEIPRQIAGYRIIRPLGEGGMGVVYEAEDTALRRPVALKVLAGGFYPPRRARARFLREARLAAALNHPNICTVYDVGESHAEGDSAPQTEEDPGDGIPYIAMELIEGQSLAAILAETAFLPLDRVLGISEQIADGLAEAHAKGIVHRDLKPGNVMVTPGGRVKILDFGLAKPLAPWDADGRSPPPGGDSASELTIKGMIVGTVSYMSPEQASGKPVDSRSDVFSFGTMLYEMTAGRRPFRGDTPTVTLARIIEADPEPLADCRPDLPPRLVPIIHRCLDKKPEERFGDARDMVAALGQLRETSTDAAPARIAITAPARRRDQRLRAWGILLAVMLLVAAGAFLGRRHLAERPSPATERKMIAVLPFENLGRAEHEYLADGISDEITTRLAGIPGLGVISRSSSIQYKGSDKLLPQIGEELGVEFVLEGSVRWQRSGNGPDRVHVNTQLIRVADDTHLWASPYVADLDGLFTIPADVAGQVSRELDVDLPDENRIRARQPTKSFEAYDYFLRGKDYSFRDQGPQPSGYATRMFETAVELDPQFAVAYAEIAKLRAYLYWIGTGDPEENRAKARQAADRAFELQPDLPEAHEAMGYVLHWCYREDEVALAHFRAALKGLPNDHWSLSGIGFVLRRQGHIEESLAYLEQGLELSPRHFILAKEIAESCIRLRKFDDAERYFDRALSLAPDFRNAYIEKARFYARVIVDTKLARELLLGDASEVLDPGLINQLLFECDMRDGEYEGALDRLSMSAHGDSAGYYLDRTRLHTVVQQGMRPAYADSLRVILEHLGEEPPDSDERRAALPWTYAVLGLKDDALREAREAAEYLALRNDAFIGTWTRYYRALAYLEIGEPDKAAEEIEYLLSHPSELSVQGVQSDPLLAPLRDHPRLRDML